MTGGKRGHQWRTDEDLAPSGIHRNGYHVHLWGNGAYPLDCSQHACGGVFQLPSVFYRPAQESRHRGTSRGVPEKIWHAARLSPGEHGMLHDSIPYVRADTSLPQAARRSRPSLGHRAVVKLSARHNTASDSDEGAFQDRTASPRGRHRHIVRSVMMAMSHRPNIAQWLSSVRALRASTPPCMRLGPTSTHACCKAPHPVDSASPPQTWDICDGAMTRRIGASERMRSVPHDSLLQS